MSFCRHKRMLAGRYGSERFFVGDAVATVTQGNTNVRGRRMKIFRRPICLLNEISKAFSARTWPIVGRSKTVLGAPGQMGASVEGG
jgi:hypothetical protein